MDWKDALARTDDAVAAVFDTQSVTILPRKAGTAVNAAPGPDPDRAEFTRLASIERDPDMLPASQRPAGDPALARSQVAYEAVMTANVRDWPYMPQRGDLVVEGDDRDDQSKRFRIVSIIDDRSDRPAFMLNRAG